MCGSPSSASRRAAAANAVALLGGASFVPAFSKNNVRNRTDAALARGDGGTGDFSGSLPASDETSIDGTGDDCFDDRDLAFTKPAVGVCQTK